MDEETKWKIGDKCIFLGKEVTVIGKDFYRDHVLNGVTIGWFSISGIFYEKILIGSQTALLKRVEDLGDPDVNS